MSHRNRRRAERVEVGIPAQLYSQRGFLEAKLCDLSRTGLRMRVRVADLKLQATENVHVVVEAVADTLGDEFALDLDYKKFGPLLQRGVTLTRVGLVPDQPLYVELCCEFDEPLADDVLAILHQELPPIQEHPEPWTPEPVPEVRPSGTLTMRSQDDLQERPVAVATTPAPAPSSPKKAAPTKPARPPVRHRYRALVAGTSRNAPPAFFCHTDLVTAVGVRVCLPRPKDAADVRNAMTKLVKAHGSTVDVRVLDEKADVWSGAARVTGVELPPDRADVMLVTLAYETPLSMATLRRFGLVAA